MTHLYIMVGLPGTGKSTQARYLREAKPDRRVIVNPDSIRAMLLAGVNDDKAEKPFDKSLEPVVWAAVKNTVQVALADGREVILDCTSLTRARRDEYAEWATEICVPYTYVVIPNGGSVGVSIARRRGQIPYEILRKMAYDYEEPSREEGAILYL